MRWFLPFLLLAVHPALADGITCQLTYSCAIGDCGGGDINIHIEEHDGQPGMVASGEDFYPVEKRVDPASGWVTYLTPVDNAEIYFMTVTPDGKAVASGHQVSTLDGTITVYAATGTCQAAE